MPAQHSSGESSIKTVLVGALLTLVLGGTAPWWWPFLLSAKASGQHHPACDELVLPAKQFVTGESSNVVVSTDSPRLDMIRSYSPIGVGSTRAVYRFPASACDYELRLTYAYAEPPLRPITLQLNGNFVGRQIPMDPTGGFELRNTTQAVAAGRVSLRSANELALSATGPIPHILTFTFTPLK